MSRATLGSMSTSGCEREQKARRKCNERARERGKRSKRGQRATGEQQEVGRYHEEKGPRSQHCGST
eukprot:scaffold280815_cov28-Tisochrysis_lutea.AAC.1